MVISPRLRQLMRWLGYPLFAVVCFCVSVYISFPYQRLKRVIEAHVNATGKFNVRIDEAGPSPLFGVTLRGVRFAVLPELRYPGVGSSPTESSKRPSVVRIDRLSINSGVLALLSSGVDVAFSADVLGGEVDGAYRASKEDGWRGELDVDRVNLAEIPQVTEAIGLPVRGRVSVAGALEVPMNALRQATGSVEFTCSKCGVGDGKAKLTVPGNPLLAMGITLPRIELGRFGGVVKVEKGVAVLDQVAAQSSDVEMHLEGKVNLRKPFQYSTVTSYIRFKIRPQLKRRDPKFELLENGLSTAKRGDGFYGVQLRGMIKRLQARPSRFAPTGGSS